MPNWLIARVQLANMALTMRSLSNSRELGLRVLAAAGELERPINWVHPTELADPTAFLDGGELLLTTGIAMDVNSVEDYLGRLAGAGVAGIGFGIELSHDRVPPALVAAAEAMRVPLLEVPKATPFIAITKAVSAAIAADEYASLIRTGKGQQELTRAAVGRRGAGAIVRKLARLTDTWVLLLDAGYGVRESVPASAHFFVEQLRPELDRLRLGKRLAASGLRAGEYDVVIQVLDTGVRGFLIVGTKHGLGSADQYIINTAASLLSLALEQNREQGAAIRRLRTGLFELLIAGQDELVRTAMTTLWGGAPEQPWLMHVLLGDDAELRSAYEVLETEFDGNTEQIFFAEYESSVVVVTADGGRGTSPMQAITDRISGIHCGISDPAPFAESSSAHQQAVQAALAAREIGARNLRFAEHAGKGLLELLPRQAAEAFARNLLAPLRRHDESGRVDLIRSLRCWLEHNGHWDLAASRLGVHRHTLRNRIDKVEQLTGRSLDSPGLRSELWLALQV